MKTLTAHEAGHYVGRLEKVAQTLETNWKDLGLTQKQALDYAYEIDTICDEIETTSKQAAMKNAVMLEGDKIDPEEYVQDHFTGGYLEGRAVNPDETYMNTFNYGPNGVHPTSGSGTAVSERTESPIQELSAYSDGFRKQPSTPYVGGSPYPEKTASKLFVNGRYQPQTNKTASKLIQNGRYVGVK